MTVKELIEALNNEQPDREILVPSALYVADEFGWEAPRETYICPFEDLPEETKETLRIDYNRVAVNDVESALIIDMLIDRNS